MTAAQPIIRPARAEDAAALAPLATQLGYPSTTADIESRLALILPDPNQLVAVAELSGQVVGWIHVALYLTLESGIAVEIRGLVVEEKRRGMGLGRALLAHAEDWARQRGARAVRLRSNVVRDGAHAFYQHLGYSVVKTQHAFRKNLD
ncbi:MAG: GNAT family N-acetyltransferase [Acidobacteriota bacterium]|nr:GNAT family N-acetyltransferase [Acidobacteriota bacterium]